MSEVGGDVDGARRAAANLDACPPPRGSFTSKDRLTHRPRHSTFRRRSRGEVPVSSALHRHGRSLVTRARCPVTRRPLSNVPRSLLITFLHPTTLIPHPPTSLTIRRGIKPRSGSERPAAALGARPVGRSSWRRFGPAVGPMCRANGASCIHRQLFTNRTPKAIPTSAGHVTLGSSMETSRGSFWHVDTRSVPDTRTQRATAGAYKRRPRAGSICVCTNQC
jgi:hypothetical protein